MRKNFENTIIFTPESPQTFLVLYTDANEKFERIILKLTSGGDLYVNEFLLNVNTKEKVGDDEYVSGKVFGGNLYNSRGEKVTVDLSNTTEFPILIKPVYMSNPTSSNVEIDVYYKNANNTSVKTSYTFSAYSKPHDIPTFNVNKTGKKALQDISSYMLMRTNPMLSGNIKLIVDEKQNIFLDTFKVADSLHKKEVRKQEVSASGNLSNDIRRVFSTTPVSDIFKINKYDTLDISSPKKSVDEQYDTEYIYGARLFKDELYSESFSILAPLWINNTLPEYFAVFKLPGAFNKESYQNTDFSGLFNNYLKDSELIKVWNMHTNFPLGKYLNNHLTDISNSYNNVYVSMNQDDPNKWNGIHISNGLMAHLNETPYEFNKLLENDNKTTSFTDINNYISTGFYRNGIVCPNLLNLTFIFNDEFAAEGEMNRYFGLYLTENELCSFNFYKSKKVELINQSDNVNDTLNKFCDDYTKRIDDTFKDRIFCLSNSTDLMRIQSKSDVLIPEEKFINKKDALAFNTDAKLYYNKKFISFTLNNALPSGVHFNLMRKNGNLSKSVYFTNVPIYKNSDISEFAFKDIIDGEEVFYVSVSSNGTAHEQIKGLKDAFDFISDGEYEVYYTENTLTLFDNNDEFSSLELITNTSYISERLEEFSLPVSFYGNDIKYNLTSCCPKHFEIFGDRDSIIVPFVKFKYGVSINKIHKDSLKNNIFTYSNNKYALIQNMKIHKNEVFYVLDPYNYDNIIISFDNKPAFISNNIFCYYLDKAKVSVMGICPIKDFDFVVNDSELDKSFKSDYWFKRNDDPMLDLVTIQKNKQISLNSLKKNSMFSILSGKGYLVFNGNYTDKKYFDITLDNDPMFVNNFFCDVYVYANDKTILSNSNFPLSSYLKNPNIKIYKGFNENGNEESILSYYDKESVTKLPNSYRRLKYGLTTPYVCKWALNGTDCRSNKLRLFFNSDIFEDKTNVTVNGEYKSVTSNYIPFYSDNTDYKFSSNFNLYEDEILYPAHKYINDAYRDTASYTYYDINDIITIQKNSSDQGISKSIKEFMIDHEYKHIDFFSKLLFKNNEDAIKKPTLLTYNKFYNTLETIFMGIKLSISISNMRNTDVDITKMNGYRFCGILSNSFNKTSNKPFEIIINEPNKYLLVIWYQHSPYISYTDRIMQTSKNTNILIDYKYNKITWLGEHDSAPIDSFKNCVYKNISSKQIFIHNGNNYELLAVDGYFNESGASVNGSGLKAFVTYSSSSDTPVKPGIFSTGNDIDASGNVIWNTSPGNSPKWISQKISERPDLGEWGDPIKLPTNFNISVAYNIHSEKEDVYNTSLKDFNEDISCSYIKGNFLANTGSPIFEAYFKNRIDSKDVYKHYVQTSKNNISGKRSIFHVYDDRASIDFGIFNYNPEKQFNSFDYNFLNNKLNYINPETFGKFVSNESYFVGTNVNIYRNKTGKLRYFEDIKDPCNISAYVISNDRVVDSNYYSGDSFINVNISNPIIHNDIITHNGWYSPIFKNIVDFDFDDKYLGSKLSYDLSLCNTKVNKTNNIHQIWYHTIKDTISADDLDKGNALAYRHYMNPCMCLWDQSYFNKTINSQETYVNGYMSSIEAPSYLGSKLVKLSKRLTLDKWSNITLSHKSIRNTFYSEVSGTNVHELSFNISECIKQYFRNNVTFTKNWSDIPAPEISKSISNIIDEYINNTIINYYNITSENIQLKLYYKPNTTNSIIDYNLDKNIFTEMDIKNLKSELILENNNIVYKIYVPDNISYTYTSEIIINEI